MQELNGSAVKTPSIKRKESSKIEEQKYDEFQTALQNYKVVWIHDTHDLELFEAEQHFQEYMSQIVIPMGLIQSRVIKLAKQIYNYYHDQNAVSLTLLVIMRGAYQFARDLELQLQKMNDRYGKGSIRIIPHFVTAKSYVGTESKIENVKIPELERKLIDRQHVLIVEDVFDSGGLMTRLMTELTKYEPLSLHSAVLLHKRNIKNLARVPYPVKWFGFTIPNVFIVGYGLDYNEHFRSMRHICWLSDKGIEAFKVQTLA